MTAPKPNAELAYRVLDAIDADPKSWDQGTWASRAGCGTSACFAGWTCILSGDTPKFWPDEADAEYVYTGDEERWIPARAADLLHVNQSLVFDHLGTIGERRLFDSGNTREDLGRLVEEIFGPRPAQLPPGEWQVCPTCGDPLTTGCRPADGVCVVDDDVPPNAGSAS